MNVFRVCLWCAGFLSVWVLAETADFSQPQSIKKVHTGTCDAGLSFINDQTVIDEMYSFQIKHQDVISDENIKLAVKDFDVARGMTQSDAESMQESMGSKAFEFLMGLTRSESFRANIWHKAPLLIRANYTGGWISKAYTIERDLKAIVGSYITGHKTGESLRNGTSTDTWQFEGLKQDLAMKTKWSDVESAMQNGTIYFNTAGSMWPVTGALCRIFMQCFGLPSNVNVYITPGGVPLSVPPHTDRQDVFVLQTSGAKRWRVFSPPKRRKGIDALNRGKSGDVLRYSEMGEPLIDTILKEGDILYVPIGFPHTTDTSTVDRNAADDKEEVFRETSVHLTMGLDTHVWALTYAHLRWSLLQRCGKDFNLNIEDDKTFWESMETPPIGFLGGNDGRKNLEQARKSKPLTSSYRERIRDDLKRIMIALEPARWDGTNDSLPDDAEFDNVIDYVFSDLIVPLFENQFEMFSNVNPQSDDNMIKAFQCSQKQNKIMEKFSSFSGNEIARKSFASRRAEGMDNVSQASAL